MATGPTGPSDTRPPMRTGSARTTSTTVPTPRATTPTTIPGQRPPLRTGSAGRTATGTSATGAGPVLPPDYYANAIRQSAEVAAALDPKKSQDISDIALGKVKAGAGLINSIINFKIPGTGIRPTYIPFYPIDKILEIENMIPGAINQVQNALEGKPVDVGSFADPFGEKGIVREAGRAIVNAPRKTELFQGAQEQRGYNQVVDNPVLALTLDIALSPTTYLSGGGAGISKGVLTAIAKGGATKAFTETGEALTKAAAKQLTKEAAEASAKKSLDDLVTAGAGSVEIAAATNAANKAAQATAKARAAVLAQEASEDVLNKAIADYASKAATASRRGVTGARSAADIAADLVEARGVAIKTLEDADAGRIFLSPKNRATTEALIGNISDEVIQDVASKGYRGFATTMPGTKLAEQIGVRSGIRWGVGRAKIWVPGSDRLANAFGGAFDASRSRILAIPGAEFLQKAFTPQGRGGLLGEVDIRDLRYNIRAGNLSGKALTEGLETLRLDRQVRAATAAAKEGLGVTASAIDELAKQDKAVARTVHQLLENPRINVLADDVATVNTKLKGTGITRPITEQELDLARRARVAYEQVYGYANSRYAQLQLAAGVPFGELQALPKTENFFPHVLTDKAILNLAKNKKLAAELGVDLTQLSSLTAPRRLKAGTKVGTYTVTADDLAKGVARINEIYRRYDGLTYDLFETDIGLATVRHINGISTDVGRLKAFQDAVETGRGPVRSAGPVAVSGIPGVKSVEDAVNFYLTPQKIATINTIPEATAQLDDVVMYLDELETLSTAPAKRALGNDINIARRRVEDSMKALDTEIATVPEASVITLEAQALSDALSAQAKGIVGNVLGRPASDWKMVRPMLDDGFVLLNETVLPSVAAKQELALMLQNARRFEDPKFVVALNSYMGKVNRFFKSWVTATPGFHTRNAISNGFFMTVAGADTRNIDEAINIYDKWLKYVAKQRGTIREETRLSIDLYEDLGVLDIVGAFDPSDALFIDDFVDATYPGIKFADREVLIKALDNLTAAGFGRTAEVFEGGVAGLGRTTGVTGAGDASNIVSQTLGKPLYASRELGTSIENYSRFALTYDGLKKGLSAEQAAARTAKFLIDYSDVSRADEVIKQIIPFWMWMSRALPLMVQQMWTNPKAFIIYKKVKNAVEDEDGELVIPYWMSSQGAVKAPFGGNIALMPDLGFTGLGEDIQSITDIAGLVSMSNPIIKGAAEALTNYDTFKRQPYRDPQYYEEDEITKANLLRFAKTLAVLPGVAQRYGRALSAAAEAGDLDTVAATIRAITQTNPAQYLQEQGVTEPTTDQNLNALLSIFGLPARAVPEYEQQREMQRRIEDIEKLLQPRR